MSAEQKFRRPVHIPPWEGRIIATQSPDHTNDPGLGQLVHPEEIVDVSMVPSIVSGITEGEVHNLFTSTNSPEDFFLPEGGFSVVGPQHFSQTERTDRAEEGY